MKKRFHALKSRETGINKERKSGNKRTIVATFHAINLLILLDLLFKNVISPC